MKFDNMDTFDYYTTKEELLVEKSRKNKKYVWN